MTNRQALTKTASKSIKKLFYFVIILVFIAGEIMEGGSATKSPFKLKLYLIRHAETVANKENVLVRLYTSSLFSMTRRYLPLARTY